MKTKRNLFSIAIALVMALTIAFSGAAPAYAASGSGSSYKQEDFTEESWNAYIKALADANAVLNDENATSADYEAAIKKLQSASDLLVLKDGSDMGDGSIELPFVSKAWSDFVDAMKDVPEADQVTLEDADAIQKARTAYDAMTREEDIANAASALLPRLQAAEAKLDELEGNVSQADTSKQTHYTENTATLMGGQEFVTAIKSLEKGTEVKYYAASDVKSLKFYSGDRRLAEVLADTQESVDVSATQDGSILAFWNPDKAAVSVVGVDGKNIKAGASMVDMFYFGNLESIDLKDLDTSAVTDMHYAFWSCKALPSLDLSSFDTSLVTDMNNMFYSCAGLTTLDLSSFDTRNVTSLRDMFYGCTKLESVNLSSFNTRKVKDMSYMFQRCSALTSLDLSSFDTRNVWYFMNMFDKCSALESVDVSSFRTPEAYNMSRMFNECRALKRVDVSKFDTSGVVDMQYMFYYCKSLEQLDVSHFDTSSVRTGKASYENYPGLSYMFCGCSSIEQLDVSNFNLGHITELRYVFDAMTSLKELKLWNAFTGKITNMDYLFAGAGLEKLDLSSWKTSSLTSCSGIFRNCANLKELNIDGWDFSNVGSPIYIFSGLKSLEELDLHAVKFVRSAGQNCNWIFQDSSGIKTIYVAEDTFEGMNYSQSSDMFKGCTSIVGGAGTTYIDLTTWPNKSVAQRQAISAKYRELARIDGGEGAEGYFALYGFEGYKVTPKAEAEEIYATETTTITAETALNYNGKTKAFDETYTFASDDEQIATVDENGIVTGVDEGIATITVQGASSGEEYKAEVAITVSRIDVADAEVSEIPDQTWTGEALEPEVTVTVGDADLEKDTDYETAYADHTDVGTAALTITGIGKYKGETERQFRIVKPEGSAVVYAGEKPYVVAAGDSLTIPATDNGEEGEAVSSWSATCGKYTKYFAAGDTMTPEDIAQLSDNNGDITLKAFYAKDAISLKGKNGTAKAADAVWTGEALTPEVTVKHGRSALNEGEDFVVTYENNVDVGTGTATIKGVGIYKDELTAEFAIVLDKTELQQAIAAAKETAANADDYTPDSYQALQDAIASAETLAADPLTTQEQAQAAIRAINTAVYQLEDSPAAEEEALTEAAETVAAAKELDENDYTAESWQILQDAVAEAETVLANENAKALDVANALQKLNDAKEQLEQADAEAEQEALSDALTEALSVNNADGTYTAESYQALQDAIAKANEVAADPNAKKSEIAAAQKAVEDAKAALQKASEAGNGQAGDNGSTSGTGTGSGTDGQKTDASKTNMTQEVTSVTKNGITYAILSKSAKTAQVAASAKNIKKAVIPKTIKIGTTAYKVTTIKANAFKNRKKLTQVTIGANVKTIGKAAFMGDKKLKKITFKGKQVKKAGKNAFKNVAKNVTVKVPKAKKKAYTKLIKKAGTPKTARIR